MLKFKCDRCGREMQRDEAWAIVLAPGAYAAEGSKERTQGEICGDCAEIILKEMIYMEVSDVDCHVAALLAMTGSEVHAGDCHVGLRHPRNDMEGSACDGEVPAAACRVVAPYGENGGDCTRITAASALQNGNDSACGGTSRTPSTTDAIGGACTRADDSRHYGEDGSAKKITRNAEGRCITVARVRMGMSQKQLADLM